MHAKVSLHKHTVFGEIKIYHECGDGHGLRSQLDY